MPLTPETLTRHELNGLPVCVVDAANPDLVGIEGRVVAETQGTLSVASADRVRQVPKKGTTFEFALTDEAADFRRDSPDDSPDDFRRPVKGSGTASKPGSETAGVRSGQSGSLSEQRSEVRQTPSDGGEGVAYVTVDGVRLLSRPALRTEKAGDSTWQ